MLIYKALLSVLIEQCGESLVDISSDSDLHREILPTNGLGGKRQGCIVRRTHGFSEVTVQGGFECLLKLEYIKLQLERNVSIRYM